MFFKIVVYGGIIVYTGGWGAASIIVVACGACWTTWSCWDSAVIVVDEGVGGELVWIWMTYGWVGTMLI